MVNNSMLKMKNKRKKFSFVDSVKEIEYYLSDLPDEDSCYKFLSEGGFSSISFVKFVADRRRINYMFASTLRIGAKHLGMLDYLYKSKRLGGCEFIVGGIMRDGSKKDKKYGYYDNLEMVCKKNNWVVRAINNHSKVILFDTEVGKYVLETSANLNENPKCEQFSFEKDDNLFEFYMDFFKQQSGV